MIGFNLVTIVAGVQFVPKAVFAMLGAMDVSDTFGPLQIECAMSGSASVSGLKLAPTTFRNGDSLDARYNACMHGSGNFRYRSITPNEYSADDDVGTGPFAGELLVAACDNSSMRMVVVDQFNMRLDLDLDGDSMIDASIPTTYVALGYDDCFCLLHRSVASGGPTGLMVTRRIGNDHQPVTPALICPVPPGPVYQ